jgi:hypothetical protein
VTTPAEARTPAFARGVDAARRVRVDTIAELAAIVAAGDQSREPERNLRLWMLDRLSAVEAADTPTSVSSPAAPPAPTQPPLVGRERRPRLPATGGGR